MTSGLFERLRSDVASRERAVESDRVHACVCARHRVAKSRALANHGEHTATGTDHIAVREFRTGMKDTHVRQRRRVIKARDALPARELSRVAARGNDHADALALRSNRVPRWKR